MRLALELAGKTYDLPASSNASRLTIPLDDGCSKGPHCVFDALEYVKSQRGSFKHSSTSRMVMRLALDLVDKSYDLLASSNASRITKRLADGCSEGSRCVFSVLDCVKLQRGPSKHLSTSRIIIRLALEITGKPYNFALDCVKLQCGSFEHPSASRITIRLTLELADKPYDLPASSNANRITKRLADVCLEDPRCVFSALDCIKVQCGPFEYPSASRITIRLALEHADKPYDLLASSNANQLTIRLADGCSEGPRCIFSALDCVELQHGAFEHPLASRITIRITLELASKPLATRIIIPLALELADKPYDLSVSSNASRLTIRLVDGYSEGPRYVFSVLYCVKLQRGPSEHPSANRITIRLKLELFGKSYDLPANSNASHITKWLAYWCSEGPRCVFSALYCIKLQRGPSEHPSANRITRTPIDKPYGPHCVFSALDCVKLQRGPFEHQSASFITIRLALQLTGKPYDFALDCLKLQRKSSEHPSTSRITIRLALDLADKPYDLPASFNASRITKRLADVCSEDPHCVFNALDCVKVQHGPSEHPFASRITIRLALEHADKPYDLVASSNENGLTIRLADGCSEGPRCIFNALNCVELQHGAFEHPSTSRIIIRIALELVGKP
ncbi:hypothetical protein L7F22_063237 [Adiantum nelumboides]|nr:hypothetical protein [Adiantum nelumboides]